MDVAVTEQAEAAGVEPFIVVPTAVCKLSSVQEVARSQLTVEKTGEGLDDGINSLSSSPCS